MAKAKSKLDYARGSRSPIPAKPVPNAKGPGPGETATKRRKAVAANTGTPVVPGAASLAIRRARKSKKP